MGAAGHTGVTSLSIVIPVYNAASQLATLLGRIDAVLRQLDVPSEIVLINDGSRDASWQRITELGAEYPTLRGINLMRNYGQHNALLAGIRAARHDVIVTIDDDLQHPPEEIPKLLDKLAEGYDVVYGTPLQEQHGFLRDAASRVTKLALQGSLGVDIARDVGPFRAFRTVARDAFATYSGAFVSVDVLLTWATTRFASIPVRHEPRAEGTSQYTLRKLIAHALNMMTGFSTMPLQVASLIGFTFTVFGLLVLAYVVVRFFAQGGSVPGFPFLASIVAIFSGAQLFALGIIGEYLARIHFRVMDKPTYTIREVTPPAGGERVD